MDDSFVRKLFEGGGAICGDDTAIKKPCRTGRFPKSPSWFDYSSHRVLKYFSTMSTGSRCG